jgi:hypothetical protein
VEIEGFNAIIDIIGLAKLLHDIGRFDIVKEHFMDTLSFDFWLDDMWGAISSIFSGFSCTCDDDEDYETETIIFTDDVITDYFIHAWEYGRKTRTPPDKNQYVTEAQYQAHYYLNFTFNMDWKLLGYTKSRRAARKSKLIIYACAQEFCEHDYLAYGLVHLYKWFKDKCASFTKEVIVG